MKKEPLSPGAERGGKAPFPRPAALPLPQPRRWLGTRATARCWGPGRRRGASDNTGFVWRWPGNDAAGSAEPPCRCQHWHRGSPSSSTTRNPAPQPSCPQSVSCGSEGKLFYQQHCPAGARHPRDCPAAGHVPAASSPGAWPPGSALACHVDVPSKALSPWGNGNGVMGALLAPRWAWTGTQGARSRRLLQGGCSQECPMPSSLAFFCSSGY